MSLFGSQNNQQTGSSQSSLFGNAGTTSNDSQTPFKLGAPPKPANSSSSGPSLFSSQAQTSRSQSGSGLFGSAANSTQQSQPNLPPSQPAQQPRSLFDRIQASDQPERPSNLFGQTTSATQQPSTQTNSGGSLFGSLNQSTAQPNQSTGPFGSTNQAQQSQPQQGSTSLFGASILDNVGGRPLAQSTAQDGQTARLQENAPRAAIFDDLLERSKKRREPGNTDVQSGQLPSLQLGLGDIASKLRSIGTDKSSFGASRAADSRAHYLLAASGIPQGATRRDLETFENQPRPPQSVTPAIDTDLETYMTNLQAKTTQQLMQESLEQSKRDFDAFLEENIQMDWDQQRRRVYEYLGLSKPETSVDDGSSSPTARASFGKSWGRSQALGSSRQHSNSKFFNPSVMSKSVLGGSISRGTSRQNLFTDVSENAPSGGLKSAVEDPYQRTRQEKYASKVRELNISRLTDTVYPLTEQFASVEMEGGSDTPRHLIEAYRALKDIVRENPRVERPSDPGAIKEREYATDYLGAAPTSAKALDIKKQILDGSRKYLEDSFFRQVQEMVARNPQEGNPGGRPSKTDQVRAYIRIRSARKTLGAEVYEVQTLGNDYCWALIFYLLRCGLIKEAAQYVSDNYQALRSMERSFPQFMAAYVRSPERRLPQEMQTKIERDYHSRVTLAADTSYDPYRIACYKVLGRCDLARKNLEGINTGVEDLLWLYFCLARESDRAQEVAGDMFGLEEVQATVSEIGQRHFPVGSESGSGYATYFFMQILAGMFEQAVSWLYPHNYVAAVHFAIALDFYGLLRVSDFGTSESQLLTFTTREQPQISFARLLGYYTRDFRIGRAEAAADYLTLICLNADLPGEAGKSQAAVCHEALKELVLETREFALLLGDIRPDGQRIKGAIEQRLKLLKLDDNEGFLRTLTAQAASVAEDNGRTTDAVLLYHLSEDYDHVTVIINHALSDALSVHVGEEQLRLQPLKPRATPQNGKAPLAEQQQPATSLETSFSLASVDDPTTLARNIIELYNKSDYIHSKINQRNRETASILLNLANAKASVSASRWADAFETIKDLQILPLEATKNMEVIRNAAQALNQLAPEVSRNIGEILFWGISAAAKQREVLQGSAFDVRSGGQAAGGLGQVVNDLMVFAGLVRFKLSDGVFEMLAGAAGGANGRV